MKCAKCGELQPVYAEIKTSQEKAVLEAAENFIDDTQNSLAYQALLTAIRKLKKQKEGRQ